MNMFAHLKSKPEMLSANDLLEIFPISRSGIYDLLREPGFPCIHLGRRTRRDDRLAREPSAGGAEQRREEQRV